jgi:predicted nucleic acid-binding protein
MAQVLDASVAIAWCATSQSTPVTTAALQAVMADGALVPAPFWFEVIHVLTGLERRQIIQRGDIEKFFNDVERLDISVEPGGDIHEMLRIHRLGAQHALSIFDASYVDLALRRDVPLSTRDEPLASAALRAGARLFEPGRS